MATTIVSPPPGQVQSHRCVGDKADVCTCDKLYYGFTATVLEGAMTSGIIRASDDAGKEEAHAASSDASPEAPVGSAPADLHIPLGDASAVAVRAASESMSAAARGVADVCGVLDRASVEGVHMDDVTAATERLKHYVHYLQAELERMDRLCRSESTLKERREAFLQVSETFSEDLWSIMSGRMTTTISQLTRAKRSTAAPARQRRHGRRRRCC